MQYIFLEEWTVNLYDKSSETVVVTFGTVSKAYVPPPLVKAKLETSAIVVATVITIFFLFIVFPPFYFGSVKPMQLFSLFIHWKPLFYLGFLIYLDNSP